RLGAGVARRRVAEPPRTGQSCPRQRPLGRGPGLRPPPAAATNDAATSGPGREKTDREKTGHRGRGRPEGPGSARGTRRTRREPGRAASLSRAAGPRPRPAVRRRWVAGPDPWPGTARPAAAVRRV